MKYKRYAQESSKISHKLESKLEYPQFNPITLSGESLSGESDEFF